MDASPPGETLLQHHPADPPDRDTRRSRAAVLLMFVAFGVTAGSWMSRLPDVKVRLDVSDARWGVLATAGSVGSLVSMLVSAWVIGRIGARRLGRTAMYLLLACAPLAASAPRPALLAAGMVTWSLSASLLQAPVNSAGVVVERRYGRPIMNSFHAGWSIGALIGGTLGAVAARAGVAPGQQLLATSLLLALVIAGTTHRLPPDERVEGHQRPGLRFTPQIVLLALLAFCAALGEGTTSGWAGIYLNETLDAGPTLAALAYTVFAASMATGRLAGDRLLDRLGRRRFLRVVPAVGAAGMAAGLAGGTPTTALAGFVLAGLGLSCVTPTVFGAAGNQRDVPSGQALATVTVISWPAFLAGPPLVGAISGATSPRVGLLVVAVAGCAVSLLVGLVRFPDTRPHADAA